MPLTATLARYKCHLFFVSALAGVLYISGCVADDAIDKADLRGSRHL